MPTVSDYVVLADSQTTLQVGGDIDQNYSFSVPGNLNPANLAVATWQLEVENPSDLNWEMRINNTLITNFTHSRDRFGAVQEVFAGSVLRTGSNQAAVRVLGGGGRIKLSDLVIHFQVNV
jgi:hypothetical protein